MADPDEYVPAHLVAQRLGALGCYWGADLDDYHQMWVTAWGYGFIVPMIGRDRACPAEVLMDIEAEVRTLRPAPRKP